MTAAAHPPADPAELAGVRDRVFGEHMYRLPPEARWRVTSRRQLFTANSLRPVAVATRTEEARLWGPNG